MNEETFDDMLDEILANEELDCTDEVLLEDNLDEYADIMGI